jgi:predicted nuclease with TOPRIM domain
MSDEEKVPKNYTREEHEAILRDFIDRKDAEIEKLEGRVVRVREYNEGLRERVKELKTDAIHNEGVMVALKEGYTEARARVEELEKDGEELGKCFENLLRSKGHHVTPKMIDAAVAFAENHKQEHHSHWDSIWEALNYLHIFRCDHLKASQINGELVEPCPDCAKFTGHGWIIRKEKDDGMD